MRSEVLRKERIGLRARNGSLGVLAMFVLRTRKSYQGGGKFHLRVVAVDGRAAQRDGFFHQSVAVDAGSGIGIHTHAVGHVWQILSDPLLVGFREIADVKPGQRIRMACGLRGSRASMKPREEFLGSDRVFARVESGTPQGFHANEDWRVLPKNLQRVAHELFSLLSLAAAKVPTVADPRQGLCLPNFNGMANERRPRLGDSC